MTSLIGQIVGGLDDGIITMKKGEIALFTLSADGVCGRDVVVPPKSVLQFEVELISWITVVDISRDGGISKKILERGRMDSRPGDLDEVLGTSDNFICDSIVSFLFIIVLPFLFCLLKLMFLKLFCLFANGFVCVVKYRVALDDDTTVAETPEQGIEFYVKDGMLFDF